MGRIVHLLSAFLLLMAVAAKVSAADLALGHSSVKLDGPWKFQVGDDPHWSDPRFDDAGWETQDLTASPGANDGDVGLADYAPGWSARGHAGYEGYAWYRLHVTVMAPAGERLSLAGPAAVDSVYQIYLDGRLLGGV